MKLCVLLVDYNSIERTLRYAHELLQGADGNHDVSIVLVENGTDCADYIKSQASLNDCLTVKERDCLYSAESRILYCYSGTNLGYARGNNLAAELAQEVFQPDVLLVSNNDIVLPESLVELIGRAERLFEDAEIGIIGPDVVSPDGMHQSPRSEKGAFMRLFASPLLKLCGKSAAERTSDYCTPESGDADWVSGCFFFVRDEAFRKAHGFDDRTFLYGEELILSTRLRRIGYRTVFCEEMKIIHDHCFALSDVETAGITDRADTRQSENESLKPIKGPICCLKEILKELRTQRISYRSDLLYYEKYQNLNPVLGLLARIWFAVYLLLAFVLKSIASFVRNIT